MKYRLMTSSHVVPERFVKEGSSTLSALVLGSRLERSKFLYVVLEIRRPSSIVFTVYRCSGCSSRNAKRSVVTYCDMHPLQSSGYKTSTKRRPLLGNDAVGNRILKMGLIFERQERILYIPCCNELDVL
jgi:hypothetical protein